MTDLPAGRELSTYVDHASLATAHDVLVKLIDYYGTTRRVSLGKEGWIGLQLAQDVIEQAIAELNHDA